MVPRGIFRSKKWEGEEDKFQLNSKILSNEMDWPRLVAISFISHSGLLKLWQGNGGLKIQGSCSRSQSIYAARIERFAKIKSTSSLCCSRLLIFLIIRICQSEVGRLLVNRIGTFVHMHKYCWRPHSTLTCMILLQITLLDFPFNTIFWEKTL